METIKTNNGTTYEVVSIDDSLSIDIYTIKKTCPKGHTTILRATVSVWDILTTAAIL